MKSAEIPMTDFSLNGQPVQALPGESIWQVAQRVGVAIPHLCHKPGLPSAGNCRACVVEVEGERVLAASCCRAPQAGMVVHSNSPRATSAQKTVLELLLADAGDATTELNLNSELAHWGQAVGANAQRFQRRAPVAADASHPAMVVNLDACIQCTRCLRACRDEQVNDVIGLAGRGAHAKIVADFSHALLHKAAFKQGHGDGKCRPRKQGNLHETLEFFVLADH